MRLGLMALRQQCRRVPALVMRDPSPLQAKHITLSGSGMWECCCEWMQPLCRTHVPLCQGNALNYWLQRLITD